VATPANPRFQSNNADPPGVQWPDQRRAEVYDPKTKTCAKAKIRARGRRKKLSPRAGPGPTISKPKFTESQRKSRPRHPNVNRHKQIPNRHCASLTVTRTESSLLEPARDCTAFHFGLRTSDDSDDDDGLLPIPLVVAGYQATSPRQKNTHGLDNKLFHHLQNRAQRTNRDWTKTGTPFRELHRKLAFTRLRVLAVKRNRDRSPSNRPNRPELDYSRRAFDCTDLRDGKYR